MAWYLANGKPRVQPVAGLAANPFGLHDLHGNVWEWCLDGPRAYVAAAEQDPEGLTRGRRVMRGGFAWYDAGWCRSACRDARGPWYRLDDFGFRVRLPAPALEP